MTYLGQCKSQKCIQVILRGKSHSNCFEQVRLVTRDKRRKYNRKNYRCSDGSLQCHISKVASKGTHAPNEVFYKHQITIFCCLHDNLVLDSFVFSIVTLTVHVMLFTLVPTFRGHLMDFLSVVCFIRFMLFSISNADVK